MLRRITKKDIKKAALSLKAVLKKDGITVEMQEDQWRLASTDKLTEEIALLMARCARDLSIEPQDLTWNDFKEYTGYAFGQAREEGIVPKHITRVGGFARIRDMYFPPEATQISVERE